MGKRPKVTELERKRPDGAHVLWLQGSCSPHCATFFSWSSIHSDEGAQMQGMQRRRSCSQSFHGWMGEISPFLLLWAFLSSSCNSALSYSAHCPLLRPSLKLTIMVSYPLGMTCIFIHQGSSAFGLFLIWFLMGAFEIPWIYPTFSTKPLKVNGREDGFSINMKWCMSLVNGLCDQAGHPSGFKNICQGFSGAIADVCSWYGC